MQKQAKLLAEFTTGKFHINETIIAKPESLSFSFRTLDGYRIVSEIVSSAKLVGERKPSEVNADEVCDIVIDAQRIADFAGKDLMRATAALEPTYLKEINKPGVQLCQARMLFAKGDFANSVALFQGVSSLKDDSPYIADLAWARFYSGDLTGALTDMRRYQLAKAKREAGTANGLGVASEIALLQRAGKPIPTELMHFAGAIPDGPWPRPLLAMQIGLITEDALLKTAEALPADARALALNDAWYYLGQHRLAANDIAGAKAAFRWFKVDGIRSSDLYLQAKAELQRLEPTDANYEAGMRAFLKEDYSTALEKWSVSAAAGLASAQYRLGLVYYYGNGMPKNYAEAMRWFEMAAAQKYPDAFNMIGIMYDAGEGVVEDKVSSISWFQKAANLSDKYAQYNLGVR